MNEQEKSIEQIKNGGGHIVIRESDMVCMMDGNGQPVEVFEDGTKYYPPKRT